MALCVPEQKGQPTNCHVVCPLSRHIQYRKQHTCSLTSLRGKALAAVDGKGANDSLHKHMRLRQGQQRLRLAVEQAYDALTALSKWWNSCAC